MSLNQARSLWERDQALNQQCTGAHNQHLQSRATCGVFLKAPSRGSRDKLKLSPTKQKKELQSASSFQAKVSKLEPQGKKAEILIFFNILNCHVI